MKADYGVPWERVHWLRMHNEELPWTAPPGLRIDAIPAGKDASDMLVAGEIDAMIYPLPPPKVLARTDRVRRLFADAKAESISHFARHGFCPIMHLLAFPAEVVERHPWLPRVMFDMYEESKRQAYAYYDDPGFSVLTLARSEFEAQRDRMAPDMHPSGVKANRRNLEQFIGFCHEQTLIARPIPVESLFHPSVVDT
ncbi:MAG: hypothetical protein EXQ96_04160 [Alphaproteobacteria bacterium]|nr:hypothetical protein [Alphaproteobacteria bacterium]